MMPETRWATSGDLSIAYQVVGHGPPDVVFVQGFVSHVELAWETPTFGPIYSRLASFARLVVFDKRGVGLSDRTARLPTLEDRMDDVRAVMDAAGIERAALVGISEGGPMTLLFAATYPERTTALVLWSTFARTMHGPDYAGGSSPEDIERAYHVILKYWGSGRAFHRISVQDASIEDAAARVADAARPGEVLVTSTVRDLVAGSGIAFQDRGVHALRGVPGEWPLLAVVS